MKCELAFHVKVETILWNITDSTTCTCNWSSVAVTWLVTYPDLESFVSCSWSFLQETHFFYFLEVLRLAIGQISFNLVKKALQPDSLPFVPLALHFMTFWLWHVIFIFCFSPFVFLLSFLLQWLTFYLACVQSKKF